MAFYASRLRNFCRDRDVFHGSDITRQHAQAALLAAAAVFLQAKAHPVSQGLNRTLAVDWYASSDRHRRAPVRGRGNVFSETTNTNCGKELYANIDMLRKIVDAYKLGKLTALKQAS